MVQRQLACDSFSLTCLDLLDRQSERAAVTALYNAGKRPCEILKSLKWTSRRESFVRKTISRYRETGAIEDRQRSGRPRSARTSSTIRNVAQLIRRDPHRSQRVMARNYSISQPSISRLIREDLHMRAYRPQRAQLLSAPTRAKRLQRSRQLFQRFTPSQVESIVFSDEKQFRLQETYNRQNNRVYAVRIEDLPVQQRIIQRVQKPASLLVWAAVSFRGKFSLHFVPPHQTIDRFYYRDEILRNVLFPEAQRLHLGGDWTFMQDGAPAHTAKVTQDWCRTNLPNFISKDEWPPSSPDLNPMDYSIWSALQARVDARQPRSLDQLRQVIQQQWDALPLEIVRNSVTSWRDRLRQCVKASGGHFEIL